jgi:hypothetical protein
MRSGGRQVRRCGMPSFSAPTDGEEWRGSLQERFEPVERVSQNRR